jgi:hypothetical protein
MSEIQLMVIPTPHGNIHITAGRLEHWACNAEIASQAAQDLDIDYEILAPDRLRIHPPSPTWNWKVYHRRYVELLVENGLA